MKTNRIHPHASALLNGRASRKLSANTRAMTQPDGSVTVRLYDTDVITFRTDGSVTVTSGGFKTNTTKDRINDSLPPGFPRLCQGGGLWQWFTPNRSGEQIVFTDGDTFGPKGALRTVKGKSKEGARVKDLTKRIGAFAKLAGQSLPLDMPSGGDDWFSALRIAEGQPNAGQPLGEATGNTEHLLSNMAENYVVPSLVWRALEACGCTPNADGSYWFSVAFDKARTPRDCERARVSVMVRRYLKGRFGLPGGVHARKNWQSGGGTVAV